jgi:hypothetical protein
VAEDARAAARRIVEEVLAARSASDHVAAVQAAEKAAAAAEVASGAGVVRSASADPGTGKHDHGDQTPDGAPPPIPLTPPDALDPRSDGGALPGAVIADALDERPSRVTARRIVEEVLAEHAAAQREVEVPAPLVEAQGPPAPPERVPARAASSGSAILPGPPDGSGPAGDADPSTAADDAASIARRIVESVLADAAVRDTEAEVVDGAVPPDGSDVATALDPDGGPPPLPVEAAAVEDDEGILHLATGEGAPATSLDERDLASETAALPEAASDADADADETVTLPAAAAEADADETVALPAAAAEADADETVALPAAAADADPDETVVLPAATSAADADETAALPTAAADADADGTLDLPAAGADEPPVRPDAGDVGGHDAPPSRAAEPEGVAVATLPRTDASAEETTPVPIAASKATRSHWLIASILGAIGLAVLLPLAVAAVRSLVALS